MILEKCPPANRLRAFSLGELNEEQSDELFGHVQQCETCQSDLDASSDDELISNLRQADQNAFADESACKLAMAKALGALAAPGAMNDSELSDLLPKVLGDYEIVGGLGRGGMGNVYLARHQKLGRQVALKVLSQHRLLQPRMRKRFEQEMRAVGQLSHANIVTAYDAREVDDLAVLVTEYIDGLDVGQIIKRTGPLKGGNACEIARQMAEALDYVNEQGLVHRDVKPSNVMVSKNGEVKVLDLGLARLREIDEDSPEMTATGQAMGTADYIAPEQVNDSRNVDIRADIYALGCTLYKMLSGRAPFEQDSYPTSFAKMTAHVSDAPPKLSEVATNTPSELASLVDRMMSKNPDDRPQTPREVAEVLSRFSQSPALKKLVETAMANVDANVVCEPSPTQSQRPQAVEPSTDSILTRNVPFYAAIAAGLLGIALGWILAGITIKIKHPDGSENKIDLPRGANAQVAANGETTVELPGAQLTDPDAFANTDDSFDPLATHERLAGIWRPVVWEGYEPEELEKSTLLFVHHEGKGSSANKGQYDESTAKKISIESEKTFSRLKQNVAGIEVEWTVHFVAPDRYEVKMGDAPKMILERLATIPVTADALEQIKNSKDTARYAKTVISIDEALRPRKPPTAKQSAMQQKTKNNLKMMSLAMLNCESSMGRLPASVNTQFHDEPTKPVSWRVLILPYLEEQPELFEQYRLDEEWDSEHNLKLLDAMPKAFGSPSKPAKNGETYMTLVAGEKKGLLRPQLELRDIYDGMSKTIMIVESNKSVPWTKPDDRSIEEILEWAEQRDFEGFNASFFDGMVRFIDGELAEPVTLEALLTHRGGEVVTGLNQPAN